MKNKLIILLRFLAFPLSICYAFVTAIRNLFYDWGIFSSFKPPIPTLVVGNLSVGGTGKSPHVEWLIKELYPEYRLAVLSRGYGRKTKGFHLVELTSRAEDSGDEPLQIKKNFGNLNVAVCEDRRKGIEKLLKIDDKIELIILDDAMQHRRISGSFTLLLSLFEKPFFKDYVLPTGNLREIASLGKKRADVCTYTKSPEFISEEKKAVYARKFSLEKPTHFSKINYASWRPLSQNELPNIVENVILVTGIAFPKPLENHLEERFQLSVLDYPDHHIYQREDIEKIHLNFTNFDASKTIILTTEKDAVKLAEFDEIVGQNQYPWFILPITIEIENSKQLLSQIKKYVENYSRSH